LRQSRPREGASGSAKNRYPSCAPASGIRLFDVVASTPNEIAHAGNAHVGGPRIPIPATRGLSFCALGVAGQLLVTSGLDLRIGQ
jgi:hypothetical protein